jgi:complex iron-sulfur molybdoenzyme family reductase subunit gamma
MQVKRVSASTEELLDPQATVWAQAEEALVGMLPTAIALQPTDYIQKTFASRPYGEVTPVKVRCLHSGDAMFVRMEWAEPNPSRQITDITTFVDGCGVLFPVAGDAIITEMGSVSQPVNAWHWRADYSDKPNSVTSTSRGTSVRYTTNPLVSGSIWKEGAWQVVMARPFVVAEPHRRMISLKPGTTVKAGFAIWRGSNQERGGIKAYSPNWNDLNIEA